MNAKHVALAGLLTLAGSACAVFAQAPDAPPADAYQQPGAYAQPDPSAPQAQAPYTAQPDPYAAQAPDPAAEAPVQYAAAQPPDYPQPSDQTAPAGPVDVSFFYNQLSPYGHWVESQSYGWVWVPYGTAASWRPYALGHWVMTDYGWTWVSDEPFGWATYHYGRWTYDQDYGWEWIPGYEWGPAWVAWRNGGGYIGWAPLPPQVQFRAGIGLDFAGINLDVVLGPTHFCFVPERSFLAANVITYVEPQARNVTIIHNTINVTKYTVVNNRVVNQGIAEQHVAQVTGQRVPHLQVTTVKSGAAPRGAQVRGGQLTVFQPTIVKRATPPPPQRARAAGADLQRQHQQETQALQAQQAKERTQLQQIHQREAQGGAANRGAAPATPSRPENPSPSNAAGQARNTPAANNQELAQRHATEVQA